MPGPSLISTTQLLPSSLPIHHVTRVSAACLCFSQKRLTFVFADISKYFGQSTPDGVQFQFRTIKKDADTIRQVEAAGGDVANCLSSAIGAGTASALSTPVGKNTLRAPKGSGTGSVPRRSTAKRPAPQSFIKRSDSDIDDDDEEDPNNSSENWSIKDVEETPSKRAKKEPVDRKQKRTPTRRAASKANATITAESVQIDDDSDHEPAGHSIFGDIEPFKAKPQITHHEAFNSNGQDMFLPNDLSPYVNMDDLAGDGEI